MKLAVAVTCGWCNDRGSAAALWACCAVVSRLKSDWFLELSCSQFTTGGWLSKDASKKPEEAQHLTFSFQAQAQEKGSLLPAQLPWQTLASTGQVADEGAMLRQALGGLDRQGGLYLTPVLYRPTVQVWHVNHSCVVLCCILQS